MRIAIISDLHLGDTTSTMAFMDPVRRQVEVGSRYDDFRRAVRDRSGEEPLDYLVLLGDVLDFSVASYADAYQVARFFFQRLKDDKLAKEIVYVPGNHDFDIWPVVEYQVNIINHLKNGKAVTPFRMSVPGIINDRGAGDAGLVLHNVSRQTSAAGPRYAGLFLDDITTPPTQFNFVYPNLYLATPDETILITHGQYLESYWAVLGTWAVKVFGRELKVKNADVLDLGEMVALNFPLSQLACSVIGQAGTLTEVVQRIEHDVKEHRLDGVRAYLKRLYRELRRLPGFFWKVVFPPLAWLIRWKLVRTLRTVESSRYRVDLMSDPDVQALLGGYFASTVFELSQLRQTHGIEAPFPTSMIFGHTHQPIPWGNPKAPQLPMPQLGPGKRLGMYNCGGWLCRTGKDGRMEFCGAEVFFYETGKGISSEAIGYDRKASGWI